MTNTQKLLDRARDLCTPQTDYQLARRLGTKHQRLSNWRTRHSIPDNEIAFKLAKMLGIPVPEVIAYFEEDKAKTPEKRAFWSQQLPRILPSIAIALTGLWVMKHALIDGGGGGSTLGHAAILLNPLYIMRTTVVCMSLIIIAILISTRQSTRESDERAS